MRCIEIGEKRYEHGDMELYDYPGKYKDQDAGLRYASIILEAEQALDQRRFASGHAISLFPGGLTTLAKPKQTPGMTREQLARLANRFPPDSEFKKYFVVRALHSYGTQDYRSGGTGTFDARGNYELQDSAIPFRAPLITPKPRIYGIQTAVVVDKQAKGFTDKSPEEIEVEELTEIYVHFYWDRNQSDEDKEHRSIKLRCGQAWASKQWGEQFIPRIGMEVIVQFLEGDPDRPIVTGCVYNGNNKPPYTLPDEKTKSGWKSDSSKNHQGYNEFMFEDKKGSELIRMHAQKDHLVQINDSQTGYVGATKLDSPYQGGDQTWTVGRNRTWTIEKGDDYLEVQQGNRSVDIDMGNYALDVKMGNISVKADLGKIEVEAMQSITLKVGVNTITLDQMGVTFDVMNFKSSAKIMTQIEALMTTVTGNAMLQLSGGIIMIG
jgi:type VI secretion system secreted protein VgrG